MKITIKDIARMAGVSISTVSRVINNSKPVQDDLRKRVLDVMEQTKFRPNTIAQNLAKNESSLIGVILPEVKNTVLDELIQGINHVSRIYGYNTMLSLTGGTLENELHYFNLFRGIQADGIILGSDKLKSELAELIELSGIPCILVGRHDDSASIPSVHVDNITAAYEAVTFLIQQGHRHIAMIRVQSGDVASGDHRFEGYRMALAEAGIPLVDDWIIESGITFEDGIQAMRKIRESRSMPTAVFCATDRIAIGAMHDLIENGLRIPDDVSVFGFDGIDMSTLIRPKLSTVKYSASEIGMVAARNLIKQIRGGDISPWHWSISHYVENRSSVRQI